VVYLSLEEEEATDAHPMASVNMRIPYAWIPFVSLKETPHPAIEQER
jgi:hypothetical protein